MPHRAVSQVAPRSRSPIAEVFLDEMLDDLIADELIADELIADKAASADDAVVEISGERTRTEASFGELSDQRTWQRLIDLAECAGKPMLAAAFRKALDEER